VVEYALKLEANNLVFAERSDESVFKCRKKKTKKRYKQKRNKLKQRRKRFETVERDGERVEDREAREKNELPRLGQVLLQGELH